jgi:osmotically inducible lipoprotein OsmB
MRKSLIIAATIAPLITPAPADAQSTTLTGAAVGVGTGAVIAGPPGAVVGGIVGGLIGASAERPRYYYAYGRACWRDRRGVRHCRWH